MSEGSRSSAGFDLSPRPDGAGPDVGAYEHRADLTEHWPLALGFKGGFGTGGIPGAGGGSGGSGTGGTPSSGGTNAAGSGGAKSEGGDSSGCGCEVAGSSGRAPWWLSVAALALVGARRRYLRTATKSHAAM